MTIPKSTPKGGKKQPDDTPKKDTPKKTRAQTAAAANSEITLADIMEKLNEFIEENAKLRETNAMLTQRMEHATKRIEQLEQQLKISSDSNEQPKEQPIVTPPPARPPKEHFDALVLTDSMFRHVGGDCFKNKRKIEAADPPLKGVALEQDLPPHINADNLKIKKVVLPGARCSRIWAEASSLALRYTFDHVLVHVGTNYLPYRDQDEAIYQINNLLTSLKELFGCQISWSAIIPRLARDDMPKGPTDELSEDSNFLIEAVRYINTEVIAHNNQSNIGLLLCEPFLMKLHNPVPRKQYLAKDGCHLNRRGIVELEHSMYDHLKYHIGTDRYFELNLNE